MTPGLILLVAGLAVGFGLLLGTTWTIQAMQPRLRRQAEERRQLNEEWLAVRFTRQKQGQCPYCALWLAECDQDPRQTPVENPPDDD